MAEAATAPPATAVPADQPGADTSAATDLGLMSLDTQDTVDVKTAWTAGEAPKAVADATAAAPRRSRPGRGSRLGNSLDSYA